MMTIYSDTLHWPGIIFLTLLLIWTFYRIDFLSNCERFPWTFAMGSACQQRTLTPPDTWSCPTLGLACVLMSRPISPELVLFPDFWVSNIPRYFSIAQNYWHYCQRVTDITSFEHPFESFFWSFSELLSKIC